MSTEIEAKRAHALDICERLEAIKAEIDASDPNPWFGGLPPLYVQASNMIGFHASAMREKFGLGGVVTGETVPSLIGADTPA